MSNNANKIPEGLDIFNTAAKLQLNGKVDEAIFIYKDLIKQDPQHFKALANLGIIYIQQKKWDEGYQYLQHSTRISPEQPIVHFNLGLSLKKQKKHIEAISAFKEAIRYQPNYIRAYIQIADLYVEEKNHQEALPFFQNALTINPNLPNVHNKLGNLFLALQKPDEAIRFFNQAIELRPDFSQAYYNRAVVLAELGRIDEAIESYNLSLTYKPDLIDAYWNIALLKILRGEYLEGWKLFEWRWKLKRVERHIRRFNQPLWLGNGTIKDKTILIYAEQGLGDVIQFSRYVKLLLAMGARVILEVPKTLVTIMTSIHPSVGVVAKGSELTHFDLQCPIMSLPLAFKTSVESIPNTTPYLYVNETLREMWAKKLGKKNRMRIGIAWSGSPTHVNDKNRSLPLKSFDSLFQLPVDFYCLQNQVREYDLEDASNYQNLFIHTNELKNFMVTAALMKEMDLIISVDTAVAHLAGSIHQPVMILLPFMPDYRWMLNREDSPWYPSARLFRQPAINDWATPIQNIKHKIEGMIHNDR